MDQRTVAFIRALRAAGIRVSVAESQDALAGVEQVGVHDPQIFRHALRSSLVKARRDQEQFDALFPLFFSAGPPPMHAIAPELEPDAAAMLAATIEALLADADRLRDLLARLMEGQPYSDDELDAMAERAGLGQASALDQQAWFARRMTRAAGLSQLEARLEELLAALAAQGMPDETVAALAEMLRQNMEALAEQITHHAGARIAETQAEAPPPARLDLSDVPLHALHQEDLAALQAEVRRLAARLRTRAALRQKKARSGAVDMRHTMRRNMRYGGVPIEIVKRRRQRKPNLVLFCDVSTSVRYAAELLLMLIYNLQDQIRQTHSFAFIDDLVDIRMILGSMEPHEAVAQVLASNPPGHYSTDFGNALATFHDDYLDLVDGRTTVIVLGDGRNNYNDPRLDVIETLYRRARRLVWFCPEPQSQWGTGDSDMQRYARLADGVYLVHSLRSLGQAVDQILISA